MFGFIKSICLHCNNPYPTSKCCLNVSKMEKVGQTKFNRTTLSKQKGEI